MRTDGIQREGREEREEERAEWSAGFVPALMRHAEVPPDVEVIVRQVIGCAIEVHRNLGPGLLEKLYEEALVYELKAKRLPFARQAEIAVVYKDTILRGQRLDLVVGENIIVEIKSVQTLLEVHAAQLLSYLRASDAPVGLLFNFNVAILADGIKRVFNERCSKLPNRRKTPDPTTPPSRSSRPSR